MGPFGVFVSLGVFGGHRSPQGTAWIQLVGPFGVFVSIGVFGGY